MSGDTPSTWCAAYWAGTLWQYFSIFVACSVIHINIDNVALRIKYYDVVDYTVGLFIVLRRGIQRKGLGGAVR